jgi:uncharacterized protein
VKRQATAKKSSPVIEAVLSGDVARVKGLLQQGQSTAEVDADGRAPLHHAVLDKNIELVRALLDARADPDKTDHRGWTALHFAAQNHHVEIARLLLDFGATVEAADKDGNTPLFRAVFESRGRGDMIALLRTRGADTYRKNNHGVSPADLANTIANFDVKRWLV